MVPNTDRETEHIGTDRQHSGTRAIRKGVREKGVRNLMRASHRFRAAVWG